MEASSGSSLAAGLEGETARSLEAGAGIPASMVSGLSSKTNRLGQTLMRWKRLRMTAIARSVCSVGGVDATSGLVV